MVVGKRGLLASDSAFDKHELAMGINEEMEHTNNRGIAKAIAKDHLMEDPKYYTKLKKCFKLKRG